MVPTALDAKDDPLSDTLLRIKLHAFMHLALDAGGNWALDFPGKEGLWLSTVHKGECVITLGGKTRTLRTGDSFLLTAARPFVLAKSASVKRRWTMAQLFATLNKDTVTCNGGGDALIVSTLFHFEGHLPKIVFGRLPPLICVPGESDAAEVLRWSLARFHRELGSHTAGRMLMLSHLAPVMLLQTLRVHLAQSPTHDSWLSALAHPKLGKVIAAMHRDYARALSLERLARLAGMSRSGFALVFKKTVGLTPMEYLAQWRMQIACEQLQARDRSLAAIASAVGYESESAFSVAFKRIVGCRPGAYQRAVGQKPRASVD